MARTIANTYMALFMFIPAMHKEFVVPVEALPTEMTFWMALETRIVVLLVQGFLVARLVVFT